MRMKLNRLVAMEECPWLDRDYGNGETVFTYTGFTYGCISPGGQACSDGPDNETPFFELPRDALSADPEGIQS